MNLFAIDCLWLFLGLLPIIAFLYASVGHGGASGYLAIMSLFGFTPNTLKPTALLLNLFVAAVAFIYYAKAGYFNKKLFFPLAIVSIPFAFWGGTIHVDPDLYKKILAVLLLFAIFRIIGVPKRKNMDKKKIKVWQGIAAGIPIGFFSGLIGIGGGIILSPLILVMRWGGIKEAAAVSALFIWVNSAAGMTGQLTTGIVLDYQAFTLVGLALAGGLAGGYLGSNRLNGQKLKYILASVLLMASIKLVFV